MRTILSHWAALCCCAGLLCAGCGDDDAGRSNPDAQPPRGDSGGPIGPPPVPLGPPPERDSGPPETDAGPGACEPSGSGPTLGGYCDLFELALFTSNDAAPEARLHGRVTPDGLAEGGCAVIDEVEVQQGGSAIATLAGVGTFAVGTESALLAAGPAEAPILSRCDADDNRFGGFGIVVRGRSEAGPFEARCADAEGGSRWPPALRITCHENLDRHPFAAYASVSVSAMFMFSSTTLDFIVPHGVGGALATVDGTIHVIPASAPFAPPAPMPFDSAGWSGTAGESSTPELGPYSMIHLSIMEAAFGTDLCPPPMTGPPGPDFMPPPVFIARLQGTGERGAWSTEAYVTYCNTITM